MGDTIALCVPAFNAAAYIPRLFDSVRRQTVAFDEVWVYDDASDDDTAAVAERFGANVVRGDVNQGCSAGKNALLTKVSSDWIHFHDADDILSPQFVARAKNRMAYEDFDVLIFDYEQVDESTGAIISCSDFSGSSLLQDPLRYMLANTVNNGGVYSTKILRQINGFDLDPSVRYNEDRAFHVRLAEAGARFAIESYVGSRFFFRSCSMSAANRAACCMANHEITKRFATRYPGKYPDVISQRAWQNAACLASCLDWSSADACVQLARETTGKVPHDGGALFKFLCRINPCWAIRIREAMIRLAKPRYRRGYPAWSFRAHQMDKSV